MKKLIVANWKMNQSLQEIENFFKEFNQKYTDKRDAWITPQSIHIPLCLNLKKPQIKVGAQNTSHYTGGAFTGEISPKNLAEMNVHFTLVGHSERRQMFGDTNQVIAAKIKAAHSQHLTAIFCLGETLAEREAGMTETVLKDQLHQGLADQSLANDQNLVVAYEPVWAIGTGKTASAAMAQEAHAFIRSVLKEKFPSFGEKIKILYGGSVKPDNVEELLAQKDIDGGLVGGASLKAKDFLALCGDK